MSTVEIESSVISIDQMLLIATALASVLHTCGAAMGWEEQFAAMSRYSSTHGHHTYGAGTTALKGGQKDAVAVVHPFWNASGWELVMMHDAVEDGAVCLDGSPGGYYIRPGTDANSSKWVVFHQGALAVALLQWRRGRTTVLW